MRSIDVSMYALHRPAGLGGTAFVGVNGSRGLVPVVVQFAIVPDSKSSLKMGITAAEAEQRNAINTRLPTMCFFILTVFPFLFTELNHCLRRNCTELRASSAC